jgi:hypothetical protein
VQCLTSPGLDEAPLTSDSSGKILDVPGSLLYLFSSIFLVFGSSIPASTMLATPWIDFSLEPGIIVGHHLHELFA